jgi:hypothetical protein
MAADIQQRQEAVLMHRMQFWGSPTGANQTSWAYKGQPWTVRRPDDGKPAVVRSVRCDVCKASLEYWVHSVARTRRRQLRWRVLAWTGLVLVIAGLASFFFVDTDRLSQAVIPPALIIGGGTIGMGFGLRAVNESGITGNFASWAAPTKHAVTMAGFLG